MSDKPEKRANRHLVLWHPDTVAMCHCFSELTEISDEQRAEVLEEHSTEELRAEYTTEELETLGVIA